MEFLYLKDFKINYFANMESRTRTESQDKSAEKIEEKHVKKKG